MGNAIKLSGRTFLAPHRGSSPKGRGGYVAVLHESVEISIASDYSTIPMTIHAALFSPSFLWKEVPRRGGGWPHETVLPHSGKPTPPRFARLPLPEEGARMIFKETLIKSLSFAVRVSRFPHMCRALLRFPHLSFMTPVPYPPLRGTFPSRGRLTIREYRHLKYGEAAT